MRNQGLRSSRSEEKLRSHYFNSTRNPRLPLSPASSLSSDSFIDDDDDDDNTNKGICFSSGPDIYIYCNDANDCHYRCHHRNHRHSYELRQLTPSPPPKTNFIHSPTAPSSNICKPHEYSSSLAIPSSNHRVLRSYVSCSSLRNDKPHEYSSQSSSSKQHPHHHRHCGSNKQLNKKRRKEKSHIY